jgi:hypothetical protein
MKPPRIACVGLSLAAAVTMTGCSSQLTGKSIQKLIQGELGSRGYAGAQIKCPDVDDKVGKKFTCTVTGNSKITTVDGSVAPNDQINIDAVH